MTGGVVKFNGKDISEWYDMWRLGEEPVLGAQHDFYILKQHILPYMQHYTASELVETEGHGQVQYYDIVVDGKTLKRGAWVRSSDDGYVGFRVSRRGDPGNPHVDTFVRPERNGVSVEEDWFG